MADTSIRQTVTILHLDTFDDAPAAAPGQGARNLRHKAQIEAGKALPEVAFDSRQQRRARLRSENKAAGRHAHNTDR